MMDWETPLMQRHAAAICAGGGDVLNVGFGMGIVDAFIQRHEVGAGAGVGARGCGCRCMLPAAGGSGGASRAPSSSSARWGWVVGAISPARVGVHPTSAARGRPPPSSTGRGVGGPARRCCLRRAVERGTAWAARPLGSLLALLTHTRN